MRDDIQKETERIHQGIVEGLSFIDALAKRDTEIERLRKDFADLLRVAANDASEHQAEIARLRAKLERAHTMWQDARIELRRMQEYYEPDPGNAD